LKNKTWLAGLVVLLAAAATAYWQVSSRNLPAATDHFASSTPAAGSRLASVPVNIVIDFERDLDTGSDIRVTSQGRDWGSGGTTIDAGGLALRREFNAEAPAGEYEVTYRACFVNGGCQNASYRFSVDPALASEYADQTQKGEVEIVMQNTSFVPPQIRISRGTKVTWVNRDTMDHYVNTDSHPAHTYYLKQNSRAIVQGDSYSTTFDTPGIYPYHCSAHAAQMRGSIIVAE
jgi:plastocyanin